MSMTPSARFHADRVVVVVQVWWMLLERIVMDGMMVVIEGAVAVRVLMVQRT